MMTSVTQQRQPLPLFPGAAHIALGHPITGLIWMFSVPVLYLFFIVPGVIAHLWCIAEASHIARQQRLNE